MQRTQIKTGDVLAHRASKYSAIRKATVLTTEPVISTYSSWGREAEKHDIALPDGTTVNAPFRLASSVSYRGDKLVLVKLEQFQRFEDDDRTKPVYEERISGVPARELIGYYDAEVAKEAATQKANQEASDERARVRKIQFDQYVGLRERTQALVEGAVVTESQANMLHIDRSTLNELLELAEKYNDLSNS